MTSANSWARAGVLAVVKELARFPEGVGPEEMTRAIGSPKPTVHRALVAETFNLPVWLSANDVKELGIHGFGTWRRHVVGPR